MSGLSLSYAVFGPLSTGADVRLLATSRGLKLSAAAKAELDRFYYAGWDEAQRHTAPYWAYFPLDDSYWGLAKAQVISKGVVGAIFVVWLALLDSKARATVGGATNRLWRAAFPEPLILPPTESIVPQRDVPFKTGSELSAGGEPAFDAIAHAVWQNRRDGRTAHFAVPRAVASTAATAVGATLERLGSWAAGWSYCTWGGIVDSGYKPRHGAFDLILEIEGERPSSRVVPAPSARPPGDWFMIREKETGIPPPPRFGEQPNYPEELAAFEFQQNRDRLVDRRDFETLLVLGRGDSSQRLAALRLLELVVPELSPDRTSQARAIDRFVAESLRHIPEDGARARPVQRIASLALQSRVVMQLAPETIHALMPVLVGNDGTRDMSEDLREQLLSDQADPSRPRASPTRLAAVEALLAAFPASRREDPLRDALLGEAWTPDGVPGQRVAVRLDSIDAPIAAWDTFRNLQSRIRSEERPRFESRYLAALQPGISPSGARNSSDYLGRAAALVAYANATGSVRSLGTASALRGSTE